MVLINIFKTPVIPTEVKDKAGLCQAAILNCSSNFG